MKAENVDLDFTDGAIREIARVSFEVREAVRRRIRRCFGI